MAIFSVDSGGVPVEDRFATTDGTVAVVYKELFP
jgi:hypothetical protein